MISFALSLRGLYSSFVVVLQLLRQLLLVGIVQGKLDEIEDEVLSTLTFFDPLLVTLPGIFDRFWVST